MGSIDPSPNFSIPIKNIYIDFPFLIEEGNAVQMMATSL